MPPSSARPSELSPNFDFLAEHDPLFVELAAAAERVFSSDPNTTLIKLRQLGEATAQHIAALSGIEFDSKTPQSDLLYRLNRELQFDSVVRELFHTLRIEGNRANHQFRTQHREAMEGLKVARELAIWFHRAFGQHSSAFKPGPFVPPADPSAQQRQLQIDIETLKHELLRANEALDSSQQLNELIEQERSEYEALALAMDEESRAKAQESASHEQALVDQQQALVDQQQAYEQKIAALQRQGRAEPTGGDVATPAGHATDAGR